MVDPARLRSQPLLLDLDEHDRAQLARWLEEVRAEPDDLLIEQGSMPYEMFLIESGTVEVIRDGERLATLGAGEAVGEDEGLDAERCLDVARGERLRAAVVPDDSMPVPQEAARDVRSHPAEADDAQLHRCVRCHPAPFPAACL